jgi:glutamate-1-semialdehyde 2,1-aminomutase
MSCLHAIKPTLHFKNRGWFAMELIIAASALGAVLAWPRLHARLVLSRAKHPSLTGHARWSQRVARQIPAYELSGPRFFDADGAPADIAHQRREGFERLATLYKTRFAISADVTEAAAGVISDLQFTSRYRVPFPFSRMVRDALGGGSFAAAAAGTTITDLDGNRFHDLTGSYGVNLFGIDAYKSCVDRGIERTRELGPVLGTLHPLVLKNARRIATLSRMDEVSFHMSGTEAVMQAVRLARYHTGRRKLVRFCGAYHGWWGDVQPGVGNPLPADDTYTLRDMHPQTLKVLATRRDIACVLVNPLQALHPNAGAPGDSALVDGTRSADFDRRAYGEWLRELRKVCTERNIALIFDEVFVGFRLARGGAQEYFGVAADLVTYGKTLGGGLPVGVVAGRARWMRRFRDDAPADICFARGTFNSHPYVMGAMDAFLDLLDTPPIRDHYGSLERIWRVRASHLNAHLQAAGLPVHVARLGSIWTVLYTEPGRYHWMLQFYLRAHGLALAWTGTGRLVFSHNFSDADFDDVCRRFIAAAQQMRADGWWWRDTGLTPRAIRRRIMVEMLNHRFPRMVGALRWLVAPPTASPHPDRSTAPS